MVLSVEVVDCSFGMAAADVGVVLTRQVGLRWRDLASGRTGTDGRLAIWTEPTIDAGIYQLAVDLDGYYSILGAVPLHPRAVVEFRVADPDADLHLPLMVTVNSYLSYRGCG
ncbi:hydroxyisourate hydrolase [Micromonospora sp. DT62]|uniref:hydroxyisourate hydrolase n=1 Tax=Micromonospora sp. DT62 TaxID=3416521 RepID=UPI003CF4CD8C